MSYTRTKILSLSVLILGLAILLVTFSDKSQINLKTSYWIWAGITANDAPNNAELYIFQGQINTNKTQSTFRRGGLFPHPIKSPPIYLVYRLEGTLPAAEYVTAIFKKDAANWQHHNVEIQGLQIDFDSATSKLLIYSKFLRDLRHHLGQNDKLSITGLGDWAVQGNRDTIKDITDTVDEVVYQLYQDRHTLPDADYYVTALERYPFPFRIGLLEKDRKASYSTTLSKNPYYQGEIYFIQK